MTNKTEKRGRKKSEYRKDAFIITRTYTEYKNKLQQIAKEEGVKLSKLMDYMISDFIDTNAEKNKQI